MGMKFIGIEGNRDCYSPDQRNSCTVGEFIAYLSEYNEDMPLYLVNDNGYTYGSLGQYDISEHYINNDGELDGEMDEEDLDEGVLHISESVTKNDVKTVMRAAAHVNTFADLESVMSSLLTIDKDLYRHYAEMLRRTNDFVSPASLGKDISDDLYWKLQAEFDVDDEFNTEACYKSHMHESHRIRKNKLSIKRTHKHPKLTK